MKRILILALFLLAAASAKAQTTQVSALVLDPTGSPYINCRGSVSFVPSPTATTQATINGSTFQTVFPINQCTSTGAISLTLVDNTQVSDGHGAGPASQWNFAISSADTCFVGNKVSFSTNLTIFGASQDITTALQAVSAPLPTCGGGGGSGPALQTNNTPNTVQTLLNLKNGTGVTITSDGSGGVTVNSSSGNLLPTDNTFTNNNRFKGPDPIVDVTAYGARPVIFGGLLATANCSGTTAITFTGGSFASFLNGDGLTIYGCGATNSMSTPGAPTVTPSLARGGTGTEIVVNSPTGAVTSSYKVVARDKFGALTAAGPATTIVNGLTLGLQNSTITTATRTNDSVVVNLSSASNLAVNALVHITGASNPDFDGWYIVAVQNSNVQFTLQVSPIDTRAMGWKVGDSSASSGGNVAYYACNHLTWTAVTSAWEYLIYMQTGGAGAYNLIGQTSPSANGWIDAAFDDFGATYMAGQTFQNYVPLTAPTVATNDPLTTTITSNGGTANIVVANAAAQTVTGAQAWFDDAPDILAAATAASTAGGTVYIPPSVGNYFIVKSFLQLPSNLNWIQAGTIATYEAIATQGNANMSGILGASGAPQFGASPNPFLEAVNGSPLLYATGNMLKINQLTFTSLEGNGGALFVFSDLGDSRFDYVNMNSNFGSAGDFLSNNMIIRSTTTGGNQYYFNQTLFNAGPTQATDSSWSPLLYIPPNQNGSGGLLLNQNYKVNCTECFLNRRGFEQEQSAGSVGTWDFQTLYRQGGITPIFMDGNDNGSIGGTIIFHNVTQDTEPMQTWALLSNPNVASFNASVVVDAVANGTADTNGVSPPGTGYRPRSTIAQNSFTGTLSNRTMNEDIGTSCAVTYPYDITGTNPCKPESSHKFFESVDFPGGNSMFWDLRPPATVTAGAATAGGSLTASTTYNYTVSATGIDGGETVATTTVANSTTSPGSQTIPVSWTAVVGAVTYNVYRCTAGCTLSDGRIAPGGTWGQIGRLIAGTSLNDTGIASTGVNMPLYSGTGTTVITDKLISTPESACPETTAPSGVVGFDIDYCDSTKHAKFQIANNGTAMQYATIVCSGTLALGVTPISSASKTVLTMSCPGLTTADNILATFNADVTSTTGYIPSTSGTLTIAPPWPTANTVNVDVVNNTSGSITPGASLTINVIGLHHP